MPQALLAVPEILGVLGAEAGAATAATAGAAGAAGAAEGAGAASSLGTVLRGAGQATKTVRTAHTLYSAAKNLRGTPPQQEITSTPNVDYGAIRQGEDQGAGYTY